MITVIQYIYRIVVAGLWYEQFYPLKKHRGTLEYGTFPSGRTIRGDPSAVSVIQRRPGRLIAAMLISGTAMMPGDDSPLRPTDPSGPFF